MIDVHSVSSHPCLRYLLLLLLLLVDLLPADAWICAFKPDCGKTAAQRQNETLLLGALTATASTTRNGTVAIILTGEFEDPAHEFNYATNLAQAAEWCRAHNLEPTAFITLSRSEAAVVGPEKYDWLKGFVQRLRNGRAALPLEVVWHLRPHHPCGYPTAKRKVTPIPNP